MNNDLVEKIAQAVLYEGYILYPYRRSVKNHHRWTFGGLYPRDYAEAQANGDAWSFLTECILVGGSFTTLQVKVRFLHLIDRKVGKVLEQSPPRTGVQSDLVFVDSETVAGKKYQRWQEAMERDISVDVGRIADLAGRPARQEFSFPSTTARESILDESNKPRVVLVRDQIGIVGCVEVAAEQLSNDVWKVSVRVNNRTPINEVISPRVDDGMDASPPGQSRRDSSGDIPGTDSAMSDRDAGLMRALVSTHAILCVEAGQFVSMTDPPPELKAEVAACRNVGVWPVLVGEIGDKHAMLASPIILYDYPQIAPESPGDLFDGGEIDEILSLRILTLTDEEKQDVSAIDGRADAMLKRTESLAREQLMNLHGAMRASDVFPAADVLPAWDPLSDRPKLPSVHAGGVELHPGDRVRLRPRGGADAFDMMLDGKIATIAIIEQDFEDRIHLAVTVEDDPGADFGVAGKPGHRFYFRPEEVEPLTVPTPEID